MNRTSLYGTQQVAKVLGVPTVFVLRLYNDKKLKFPANRVGYYYMTESKDLYQWMETKEAKLYIAFAQTYEAVKEAYREGLIDKDIKIELWSILRKAKTIEAIKSVANSLAERKRTKRGRKKVITEITIVKEINRICDLLNSVLYDKVIGIDKERIRSINAELVNITQKIHYGQL